MTHERIYGIYQGTENNPTFHYVGQTKCKIEKRFAQHLRLALNPSEANEAALKRGARILSAYTVPGGKIWVITEA